MVLAEHFAEALAAFAATYEVNGVEYVVYGFGGEPGNSFCTR
jgi:hypothetical protein